MLISNRIAMRCANLDSQCVARKMARRLIINYIGKIIVFSIMEKEEVIYLGIES